MAHPLILPMAAHVALAAFLYVLLTVARAPKIWGIGQRPDGSNPWAAVEARISANLSNQFEWPLFLLHSLPASHPESFRERSRVRARLDIRFWSLGT